MSLGCFLDSLVCSIPPSVAVGVVSSVANPPQCSVRSAEFLPTKLLLLLPLTTAVTLIHNVTQVVIDGNIIRGMRNMLNVQHRCFTVPVLY